MHSLPSHRMPITLAAPAQAANSSLLLPSLRAENERLRSQAHELESALSRLPQYPWQLHRGY